MDTSIFEIIGPIMIGPSSSHTAGMARIGLMANQIIESEPTEIRLTLHEAIKHTYVGHCTDIALIGGVLGIREHDDNICDALEIAKDKQISVNVGFFPDSSLNPNTVQIDMIMSSGETCTVRGISIGGGSIIITEIDGVEITLSPSEYHVLIWTDNDISKDYVRIQDEIPIVSKNNDGLYITKFSFDRRPDEGLIKYINSLEGIKKYRLVSPVLSYGHVNNSKPLFSSFQEVIDMSKKTGKSTAELAIDYEINRSGKTESQIREQMALHLDVMRKACKRGIEEENHLNYGLTSGKDGKMLAKAYKEGKTLSGGIVPKAIAYALGTMEVNGSMGRVVAAPTAGSCGIVPGCLITVQESYGYTDDQIIDALLTSALTGVIMAQENVSFSGVVGGCQGEVGASSAIAAAGLTSLKTDDVEQIVHSTAMAIKNILGLICDPIAGPVEVPCIKRNAIGVANAFAASDMALAGIKSYIPPDEVVDALVNTQKLLPKELKGTAKGGLACTCTAKNFRKKMGYKS